MNLLLIQGIRRRKDDLSEIVYSDRHTSNRRSIQGFASGSLLGLKFFHVQFNHLLFLFFLFLFLFFLRRRVLRGGRKRGFKLEGRFGRLEPRCVLKFA